MQAVGQKRNHFYGEEKVEFTLGITEVGPPQNFIHLGSLFPSLVLLLN